MRCRYDLTKDALKNFQKTMNCCDKICGSLLACVAFFERLGIERHNVLITFCSLFWGFHFWYSLSSIWLCSSACFPSCCSFANKLKSLFTFWIHELISWVTNWPARSKLLNVSFWATHCAKFWLIKNHWSLSCPTKSVKNTRCRLHSALSVSSGCKIK